MIGGANGKENFSFAQYNLNHDKVVEHDEFQKAFIAEAKKACVDDMDHISFKSAARFILSKGSTGKSVARIIDQSFGHKGIDDEDRFAKDIRAYIAFIERTNARNLSDEDSAQDFAQSYFEYFAYLFYDEGAHKLSKDNDDTYQALYDKGMTQADFNKAFNTEE
jgi:hypothetical protein